VVLPDDDMPSNTVYTVTIVDAIMSILAGNERPGAFDVTNVPQWTWHQVYEYESSISQQIFVPQRVRGAKRQVFYKVILGWTKGAVSHWLRKPFVRRKLERWLALAPSGLNDRAQAIWFKMRARAEIGEITANPTPAPELSWIRLDRRNLTSLQPTERLLTSEPYNDLTSEIRSRWPRDLELAGEVPARSTEQAL
jgi:hypothetical protein